MPNLSYVDFIPHLIDEKSCFSTLSLSSGVPGPIYESFDSQINRANSWLHQNPEARVVSCETILTEGIYGVGDDDDNSDINDLFDERRYQAFLNVLRIWFTTGFTQEPSSPGNLRAQQIGYKDVLPARLESNPDAFGPKYESLGDALKNFNQKMMLGEDEIPGRMVSMETCTCRFTTKNCSVDPSRTFWMTTKKSDVHCYHFFRIFYTLGHSSTCELGFTDFAPSYSGKPRKGVKSENFVHLTRRAEQWFQSKSTSSLQLVNVQTLNHNMLFKCIRDGIGHEKKVLENPHCVHNHGNCIYHTKVLRLYFTKQPVASVRGSPLNNKDSADNGQHVLHKTFHIPAVVMPSTVKLNGDQRALLPLHHMEDTMAKVRRWIAMTGVKVKGVETVKLISHHTRDHLSAENTHFESGGLRNSCIVYALRLYIHDEAGSLSKKDLNPDPKSVKLFDHHCCIL